MNSSSAVFLATLLLAPTVLAASSADFAVTGTITPNACEPMLSSGGVVDYGKMTAKELSADRPTSLPWQTMQLEILCEAPTFIGLSTIDNRSGTSAINDYWHGLGLTSEDEKVGSTAFGLFNPVADGASVKTINSTDGGTTWLPSIYLGHYTQTSVAAAGSANTPIAVRHFSADLRVYTMVNSTDRLTVLDEVPLDGHATVELKYL
ncbi:DUF1120 domain-containing protein [Pseudomonas yamanorum]|jgi:hypothetical protein|uniref:DUF1120 domain-containing protein n=1 Tax=Pseudomonas yamanorum TaxID=515393 RepID=UPI003B9DFDC3